MTEMQECPDCDANVLESDEVCWRCGANLELRRKWGDVNSGP